MRIHNDRRERGNTTIACKILLLSLHLSHERHGLIPLICVPEVKSSPHEMHCVQGGQSCDRLCKRNMSAILMQLKAWYMWASSCNFSDPVSKDVLHCINIVRIVAYQRNRHRFVPSASVCRNAHFNSYYLPFGRKTGIRCRTFMATISRAYCSTSSLAQIQDARYENYTTGT